MPPQRGPEHETLRREADQVSQRQRVDPQAAMEQQDEANDADVVDRFGGRGQPELMQAEQGPLKHRDQPAQRDQPDQQHIHVARHAYGAERQTRHLQRNDINRKRHAQARHQGNRQQPDRDQVAQKTPGRRHPGLLLDGSKQGNQHLGELNAQGAIDHEGNGQRGKKRVGLVSQAKRGQNHSVQYQAGQHPDGPAHRDNAGVPDQIPLLRFTRERRHQENISL